MHSTYVDKSIDWYLYHYLVLDNRKYKGKQQTQDSCSYRGYSLAEKPKQANKYVIPDGEVFLRGKCNRLTKT